MKKPVLYALALTGFMTATLMAGAAQAQPTYAAPTDVQGWVSNPETSYMKNNPADQRIPRVPMEQGNASIYFDPNKLDKSSIQMTMGMRSPNEKAKEPVSAEALFVSRSIKKTGQNSFEAEGDLYTNKRHTAMKVPFVVNFDKTAAEPTLVFDGDFKVNSAQAGLGNESKDFPTEIPVNFHFVTTPLPVPQPLPDSVPK